MPDNRKEDLCKYRIDNADETLVVATECYENGHYKDAINRSYYAAFYAIKAILALEEKDFKGIGTKNFKIAAKKRKKRL